jgi:CheY-like chemotaxis protein/HPt (histidine-containing phosphotransfer) domain-containing protein
LTANAPPGPFETTGPRCELLFSIRDTGLGIGQDKIERLFKPFSQAETSTSRQYGGTGLGLAICRRLIELMGGKISVQSTPGSGSNFYFSLVLPVLPQPRQEPESKSHSRIDPGLAQRYPLSVLLVDDDIIGQKAVLQIFQQLGYHADVAINGTEAIQSWERQHYDLLFLDVQMPELDGLEATRRIRQVERNRTPTQSPPARTIIIAMTANAFPEDRAKCLAVGMDDYLSKPLRPREVQAMIEKWGARDQKSGATATVPSPVPVNSPAQPKPAGAPSVDLERMNELADGQPQYMKELAEIYLQQTEAMIKELKKAATTGSASEIQRLAHKCAGSSGTCGMTNISALFNELESQARKGTTLHAATLVDQATAELQAIRHFLTAYFQSPPSPTAAAGAP